jgi:RNA polymerase sigma-70 factor (ECF subfamily)
MAEPASDPSDLLRRAGDGDTSALGQLLDSHRARLRRMVKLRLDTRLRGRIDTSDVLQEAYLEAAQRLAEYLRDPKMPFVSPARILIAKQFELCTCTVK